LLDLHEISGQVYVCHQPSCLAGDNEPVDGPLSKVKAFLAANPREVVTLILESYVTEAALGEALQRNGLLALTLTRNHALPNLPWPTLREMITLGTRLVVLDENSTSPTAAWNIPMWKHTSETSYSVSSPLELSCAETDRGQRRYPLFQLNHFTSASTQAMAGIMNQPGIILDRARECGAARGRVPNFVNVNFHDYGDVVGAVRGINRIGESSERF
jgi:hypothetical protein